MLLTGNRVIVAQAKTTTDGQHDHTESCSDVLHALRHSSVTNVYRKTRDLFLAQRFARHASPLTTTVYTHPSDDEMCAKLRGIGC